MNLIDKYKQLKSKYYQKTNISYRKDNGQIFTPIYIANFMTNWILRAKGIMSGSNGRIIDPALGLGVFFQSIINLNYGIKNISSKHIKIYGIEKDQNLYEKCTTLYSDYVNIFLQNGDYLLDWDNQLGSGHQYDGIICNPPYLIYKKFNNTKYLSLFEEKMNVNLSGFTNLCMLFILKSLTELKKGGRMAYIVPSEFMNADYGKEIKKIIKEYGFLRNVIILNYNLFEVNTTSSILLFSNEDNNNSQVQFINVNNKEEFLSLFYNKASSFCLEDDMQDKGREYNIGKRYIINKDDYPSDVYLDDNLYNHSNSIVLNKNLDYKRKWRFYYQQTHSSNYQNLVKLSEYAKVLRGIATGANDFFLFNESKKNEYQIEDKYLIPCISRSSYVNSYYINNEIYKQLVGEDKKVFLLDAANKEQNQSLKKYIKYGEKMGYDQRYLTRNRKPWYRLEDKPPAPILAKVFNRNGLQIFINGANLYNLTAFHSIYIKSEEYSKLLKAYLLSDIARKIIEDNRREYGDGLNKFEPNDLNNSLVLDLKIINKTDQEEIFYLYENYCKLINSVKSFNDDNVNINEKKGNDKEDKYKKDNDKVEKQEYTLSPVKGLSKIFLKYLKK